MLYCELAAVAVGDVEDVHEPPAVGGDVGLLDGQVEVGEHLHRLEQDATLSRAVNLDQSPTKNKYLCRP